MRRPVFFVLIFLVIFGIIGFFWGRTRPQPAPVFPPKTQGFNSWRGITPGDSTVEDISSLLGPPLSATKSGTQTLFFYPSSNQYWKNEVAAAQQKVVFLRERIFPPSEISLTSLSVKIRGQPILLYGPDFQSGITLFVYPPEGIAFYASADTDTVFEVWRFSPTTVSDLLALPQFSGYALSPPRIIE